MPPVECVFNMAIVTLIETTCIMIEIYNCSSNWIAICLWIYLYMFENIDCNHFIIITISATNKWLFCFCLFLFQNFTLHWLQWIILHNLVNLHIVRDEQWELGQEQEQDEEDATDGDTRPGQCGLGQILWNLPVDIKPEENKNRQWISTIYRGTFL